MSQPAVKSRGDEALWIFAIGFVYTSYIFLVGLPATAGTYLYRTTKKRIVKSHQGLEIALFLLTLSYVGFVLLIFWEQIKTDVILRWSVFTPAVLLADVGYRGLGMLSRYTKPKSLQEKVDVGEKRQDDRRRSMGDSASRRGEAEAEKNQLQLGAFIKGRLPDQKIGFANRRGNLFMDNDLLNQHLFVLGATGAGKSETIKRILFDVLKNTDRDIYFVDGKGDLDLANDIRAMTAHFGGKVASMS